MNTASAMQQYSGIFGQAEQEFSQNGRQASGRSSEMGRNEFLKLLVTQLEHQDPTDPMKDEDFVAQLAQFSSLEQLTNISDGVKTMNQSSDQGHMLQAVSFLGKEVSAEGSQVSKEGDSVSSVAYSLPQEAASVNVNIIDANGNIVRTVQAGAKQAGNYTLSWDGLDYTGSEVPDGVYSIGIRAVDGNGKSMQVDTAVSGTVSGVKNSDGNTVLTLNDGREVTLTNIRQVIEPSAETEQQ